MRDDPHGAALLADARRQLLEGLLPGLTGKARYDALLIAHALAIAEREIAAGEAPLTETRRDLSELLGRDGSLAELSAELATKLRAGALAGDAGCYRQLRRAVLRRLAESNPRELPPGEAG